MEYSLRWGVGFWGGWSWWVYCSPWRRQCTDLDKKRMAVGSQTGLESWANGLFRARQFDDVCLKQWLLEKLFTDLKSAFLVCWQLYSLTPLH